MPSLPDLPEYMDAAEVAQLFGVNPKTVVKWAKSGKLPVHRTVRGEYRYRRTEIADLQAQLTSPRTKE